MSTQPLSPPSGLSLRTTLAKSWVVAAVVAICGLAFALRCLHLLDKSHYFVVSPDSYFFHHMAELVMQGEKMYYPTQGLVLPWAWHSGITYPVGMTARALSILPGVSGLDALGFTSRFLPPIIGVVTVAVLYVGVARMYGRLAALLSAFVWAALTVAVFFQAAGYLDRDGLSILLIIVGVFTFYFLCHRPQITFGRDVGWVTCAVLVLAVEAILYMEWLFLGPAILLAILVVYVAAEILNDVARLAISGLAHEEDVLMLPLVLTRGVFKNIVPAMRKSGLKPLTMVLAVSLVAAVAGPGFGSMRYWLDQVIRGTVSGTQTIGELQGLTVFDLLSFGPLLIPLAIGTYVMAKERRPADLLFLSFAAILALGGLFARRLFYYAAPALCIVSGVGLAAMLDFRGLRLNRYDLTLALVDLRTALRYLRIALSLVLLLVLLYNSGNVAYTMGRGYTLSVGPHWHDALTYLRDETPRDTVVMTHWNYGYWILDVAKRTPVIDNGTHPDAVDQDVATVYCTVDDSQAVAIMRRYGAEYLIFSKLEIGILASISRDSLGESYGDGDSIPAELKGSLFARALKETFHSDSGLERVYFATDTSGPAIVILKLI